MSILGCRFCRPQQERLLTGLFHIDRELKFWVLLITGLLLPFTPLALAVSTVTEPERVVHEVTLAVTQRLANSVDQLAANPAYVKTIVVDLVLPHFDFPTLAAEALQRYWEELSEGEQRCVSNGFRERLVERYARFLLDYEYTSIVTDAIAEMPQKKHIYVTQTAMTPHPQPLPIKYKMEFIDGAWKVVDLVVADVSLVKSYRISFAEEIEKIGIGDFLRTFPECKER